MSKLVGDSEFDDYGKYVVVGGNNGFMCDATSVMISGKAIVPMKYGLQSIAGGWSVEYATDDGKYLCMVKPY